MNDRERRIIYDLLLQQRKDKPKEFKQKEYDLAWKMGRELGFPGYKINAELCC